MNNQIYLAISIDYAESVFFDPPHVFPLTSRMVWGKNPSAHLTSGWCAFPPVPRPAPQGSPLPPAPVLAGKPMSRAESGQTAGVGPPRRVATVHRWLMGIDMAGNIPAVAWRTRQGRPR
jgi:hypothetical protein